MCCARLCPHNAGKVSGSMVSVAASPIKKACSVRKRKRTIILRKMNMSKIQIMTDSASDISYADE